MKVFYRRNSVYAKAESLVDIKLLLNMKGANLSNSTELPSPKSGWARRMKEPCNQCGKSYKNVKLHAHIVHPN